MVLRKTIITLLNILLGVTFFFLGFRIILKMLAANPGTPFVNWIYLVSDVLISPFRGIFINPVLEEKFIFDIVALIALVIYVLLIDLLISRAEERKMITHSHAHSHEPES